MVSNVSGLSESVRRRADPTIKPGRGKEAERDGSHLEEWGRQVVRKRGGMTDPRLDWLYCASALPGLLRVYHLGGGRNGLLRHRQRQGERGMKERATLRKAQDVGSAS